MLPTRLRAETSISDIARESNNVTSLRNQIERGIETSITYLRQNQVESNRWVGVLSSSALATSMSIVALKLYDETRYSDRIQRGRQWLLRTQLGDGGWGDALIDESNINATSLAIGALTFTDTVGGLDDTAYRTAMDKARERLERFGGFDAVGDPQRCTLSGPCRTVAALAGIMDWKKIKRLRPEVILIPARLRRTISTTFPAYLAISMLHSVKVDHPLNHFPSYPRACEMSLRWLAQTQGPNGSFEESAFLSSVIIMGLTATGHHDLPWVAPTVRFVLDSQRQDGGWPIDRDLETFDTDMTVFALKEAGVEVPAADQVRDWLLSRQFTERCFPTSAAPGGWAWAMPAGWPDSDDTSYTLLALRQLGMPASNPQIRKGARWLKGMQNSNGAWPTFVRNSKMPFDHDCPYITGHVLTALYAAESIHPESRVLQKALVYLTKAQRYDGSFGSIWFREATAGTASVLEALAHLELLETPMAAGARDFLLRSQNEDGGWAGIRMQQRSTAEETSWAMMALMRCPPSPEIENAVRRGTMWLLGHQRKNGTWAEAPIALYYSAMWYSDSYYAITLPLQALARARKLYAVG